MNKSLYFAILNTTDSYRDYCISLGIESGDFYTFLVHEVQTNSNCLRQSAKEVLELRGIIDIVED